MTFHHPLSFISPISRRWLFLLFTGLTFAGFIIFLFLDRPAQTQSAPSGIVSFELAGSVANAQAMMDSWNDTARINIAFGLGFDFLFMPVYAGALSLGVLLAEDRRKGSWTVIGKVVGWGAFVAIVFDSIENIALFSILQGHITSPYPQLAAWCASIKFLLIICGIVYGLVGWFFPEKRH